MEWISHVRALATIIIFPHCLKINWVFILFSWFTPDDVPTPRRGCNEKGLLCMNIADQYTRGSHFVITLQPDPSLDG